MSCQGGSVTEKSGTCEVENEKFSGKVLVDIVLTNNKMTAFIETTKNNPKHKKL